MTDEEVRCEISRRRRAFWELVQDGPGCLGEGGREAWYCFVCGQMIRKGYVYHADLEISTHRGECQKYVDGQRRSYERSKRGRWRPKSEVLANLVRMNPEPWTPGVREFLAARELDAESYRADSHNTREL